MSNLDIYLEEINLWSEITGAPLVKRPENARQAAEIFERLECDLSPENLYCDGELSRRQAASRHTFLNAVWREVEAAAGHYQEQQV